MKSTCYLSLPSDLLIDNDQNEIEVKVIYSFDEFNIDIKSIIPIFTDESKEAQEKIKLYIMTHFDDCELQVYKLI